MRRRTSTCRSGSCTARRVRVAAIGMVMRSTSGRNIVGVGCGGRDSTTSCGGGSSQASIISRPVTGRGCVSSDSCRGISMGTATPDTLRLTVCR